MKKKGHAAGIAFTALITVGFIAAGVGTQSWAVAEFSKNNTVAGADCVVTRTMGLFSLTDSYGAECTRVVKETYDVYCSDLVDFNHGLQYAVIAFSALSMLFCLIILAVAAFNICENPYQTYCSPFGLAVYNVIGLVCSLLAVILYVALLYTDLVSPIEEKQPDNSADTCAKDGTAISNVYLTDYDVSSSGYFGFSFFLVMSSIFVYCIGIGLSIHAQKTPKKDFRSVIGQTKNTEITNPAHEDVMIF